VLGGLLAALLAAWPRAARADAAADLEKAHNAYVAHQYDEAETRLRALLDPNTGTLVDPDRIADARMYLAATLLAEKKREQADAVLEQLLVARPDYQPDPLRVSLEAIDALTDARTRLRAKLAEMQAEKVRQAQEEKARAETERQKQALRLAMLERLASTEVVTERSSRWIALVPFGVGQFQNGQTALGWTLLVGEGLLAAGSVVSAGVMFYDVGLRNDAIARNDGTQFTYNDRAQTAAYVGDALAGGFALVAALGILHAQLTFVPEKTTSRRRPIPPVSLAPSLGPGGVGVVGAF
jgi:hypothetical protein